MTHERSLNRAGARVYELFGSGLARRFSLQVKSWAGHSRSTRSRASLSGQYAVNWTVFATTSAGPPSSFSSLEEKVVLESRES